MTIEERNTARAIQDIAKEMKKTQKIDWEQRRYEIAKDIVASMYGKITEGVYSNPQQIAYISINAADALIAELRKGKE